MKRNAETTSTRTERDDITDLTRIQANLINARNLMEELPDSATLREMKSTINKAIERTSGWPTGRYTEDEE